VSLKVTPPLDRKPVEEISRDQSLSSATLWRKNEGGGAVTIPVAMSKAQEWGQFAGKLTGAIRGFFQR
jgi:uncharacterized protein YdaT